MSDIYTAVVESLKVLDPKRPIREADVGRTFPDVANGPRAVIFSVRGGQSQYRCRASTCIPASNDQCLAIRAGDRLLDFCVEHHFTNRSLSSPELILVARATCPRS